MDTVALLFLFNRKKCNGSLSEKEMTRETPSILKHTILFYMINLFLVITYFLSCLKLTTLCMQIDNINFEEKIKYKQY